MYHRHRICLQGLLHNSHLICICFLENAESTRMWPGFFYPSWLFMQVSNLSGWEMWWMWYTTICKEQNVLQSQSITVSVAKQDILPYVADQEISFYSQKSLYALLCFLSSRHDARSSKAVNISEVNSHVGPPSATTKLLAQSRKHTRYSCRHHRNGCSEPEFHWLDNSRSCPS